MMARVKSIRKKKSRRTAIKAGPHIKVPVGLGKQRRKGKQKGRPKAAKTDDVENTESDTSDSSGDAIQDKQLRHCNNVLSYENLFKRLQDGKPAEDDVSLSALNLKPNMEIMMMGTREEALKDVMNPPEEMPEVVNDFDLQQDEIAIENREDYLSKIERRIRYYNVEIINEPRPGKHLLVLDIDYTPFAATRMKWIKAKIEEFGMDKHPRYKLCFYLDSVAMITVHTPKYGLIDVKPLGVIWGKFKQWSSENTIMFDDSSRNFIMNPQSGLKIRPFRQAHVNRGTDRELLKLAKYLKAIASLESFTDLNHRKWEKYHSTRKNKHIRSSEKDKDGDGTNPQSDSQSGSSNQDSNNS